MTNAELKLYEDIMRISFVSRGKVLRIIQSSDETFVVKQDGYYIAAIQFDWVDEICEDFVGMSLKTDHLCLDNNTSKKVLCLRISSSNNVEHFAYIAKSFLDLNDRQRILKDSFSWIDEWKEIFGDSTKKYTVYDVVGELYVLKYIYKNDKTAKWQGADEGTHDIVAQNQIAEVKSTKDKSRKHIHINSQFQINPTKNEKIYFVRLEPKPYTNSINSIVKELINLGYPEKELEEKLKKKGYSKGKRIRNIEYDILALEAFDVNDTNFPVISTADLNNMTKSHNIVNYQFEVDLGSKVPTKIK